jgi:hypothetical protein
MPEEVIRFGDNYRLMKAVQDGLVLRGVIGDSLEVLDSIRECLRGDKDPERLIEMVNGYIGRARAALRDTGTNAG